MADAAMRPTGADVEDFVGSVEQDQRRADARALVALMSEVTGEDPVIWGSSIVGFGSYHYRYATGREGDAPLASFSPRKSQLVLYLVGGFDDRHAETLRRLGPHQTGKSCLYVKRLSDVDLQVLRTLVDASAQAGREVDRQSRGVDQQRPGG